MTVPHFTPRHAYREFVRASLNDPGETANLTAHLADTTVRLGINSYRCTVEAQAYGAFTLTRPATGRTIRLDPAKDVYPHRATERQVSDLQLIAAPGPRPTLEAHPSGPSAGLVIDLAFSSIPAAATERLVLRGWVSTLGRQGDTVTVSIAGHLALARHQALTEGAGPGDMPRVYAEAVHAFALQA